ncbi:MAG: prepilin-type N-terminal cleavage/methylation domain-containing protein [Pseudomonadota bacterium]
MNKINRFRISKIKKGFSLFELTIVIAIIAFLGLGIMQGGELIRQSKISAAQTLTKSSVVSKMDNLVLWLETTMPNSFDNIERFDGGTVSNWYNLGVNQPSTYNATQSNNNKRPTYATNAINGLPALKFISTSTQYMSVVDGFDNEAETVTVFLVWQPNFIANSVEMDPLEKWAGSGGYPYVLRSSTTFYAFISYDGSTGYGPASTTFRSFGTPHLISARKIRKGAMQLWVNGTSEGGTATDGGTSEANNVNMFIGCRGNITLCVNGYIGEIIIFDRALTDQERQDVETYLGKKWAISTP